VLLALSVALAALCTAANMIQSPYTELEGASPYDAMAALVVPPTAPTPPPAQHFYITTVMATPLSWWGYITVPSSADTTRSDPLRYPTTSAQNLLAGQLLMISSQRTALYLAQLATHTTPTLRPSGAQAALVGTNSPAARAGLRQGDVITAVNSQPTPTANDLVSVLSSIPDGHALAMKVQGPTSDRKVTVAHYTGPHSLGIEATTYYHGTSAYQFDLTAVDGPSGGLMLALAATTAMAGGDLSAGYQVAGSATIDPDGKLGPISGISQKVASAFKVHADLFFTTPADYRAATAAAYRGLTVVPVTTLDQAVSWLCRHGATSNVCVDQVH
jgi:PDZ domain-containing protein